LRGAGGARLRGPPLGAAGGPRPPAPSRPIRPAGGQWPCCRRRAAWGERFLNVANTNGNSASDAAVRGRLDEAIGAADRALQTAAQLKQLPRRQVSAGAENIKPRLRSSSARPVAPTTTPRATAEEEEEGEEGEEEGQGEDWGE
ncbi:unnamed protein product, partial [Prorocentrum cordatum]